MEYERILNLAAPQAAGGFSPAKLRAMLLGVQKHRTNADESGKDIPFAPAAATAAAAGVHDDTVSMECSTSTETSSGGGNGGSAVHRKRGQRARSLVDDDSADSGSNSSTGFDFPTAERTALRPTQLISPFLRPAPSKWDDADKWISSPTANRTGSSTVSTKKSSLLGEGGGRLSNAARVSIDGPPGDMVIKPAVFVHPAQILTKSMPLGSAIFAGSKDESPAPAAGARPVSMRDMGTEMTPIASQEPSRTGTPVKTSALSSPSSSIASTPHQIVPNSSPSGYTMHSAYPAVNELSAEDLEKRTRREIMALGKKLGKTNIAAWAGKEDGEAGTTNDAADVFDEHRRREREARAADWAAAEREKYLAKFERDEAKTNAWEKHQRAKIETEMRKIEAKVEKMRAHAHEKLMNKLAAARHRAEGKRAAAESRRAEEASRTARQADDIRRTGRVPSTYSSCWTLCF